MKGFEINNRINELIEKLNITPYEFSKRIGNKRPDGLYRILKNEVKPTPKTLEKIKEVFSEYYFWLLTGDGSMLKDSVAVGQGEVKGSNQVIGSTTGVAINADVNDQIKEFADILKTAQDQQTKLLDQLSESQRQVTKLIEQQEKLLNRL